MRVGALRVDFAYFFNMNQRNGKINYSRLREEIGRYVANDPLSGRVNRFVCHSPPERAQLVRADKRVGERAASG